MERRGAALAVLAVLAVLEVLALGLQAQAAGNPPDGGGAGESVSRVDRPTMLVENIRRKLMVENYDYMPSTSSEDVPGALRHELASEPRVEPVQVNDLDSAINDHFIARAVEHSAGADHLNDKRDNSRSRAVSMNDLLYYVNDDRLEGERSSSVDTTTQPGTIRNDTNVTNEATTTTTTMSHGGNVDVKYKVLKVKQGQASRRRGGGGGGSGASYRRFIEEETPEGVAIMTLDELALPQFRLPAARRQYMMDQHEVQLEVAGSAGDEELFMEESYPSPLDQPTPTLDQ